MWMYARFGKKYLHAPGFFGKEQSNNKNSKLRFQAEIIELSGACEASRVSHSYVQSIVLTFVDNYIVKSEQRSTSDM